MYLPLPQPEDLTLSCPQAGPGWGHGAPWHALWHGATMAVTSAQKLQELQKCYSFKSGHWEVARLEMSQNSQL